MPNKTTWTDKPDGQISVVRHEEGKYPHRHVITPGQNLDTSNDGGPESPEVKARALEIHTPVVVTVFRHTYLTHISEQYAEHTAAIKAKLDDDPTNSGVAAAYAKMEALSTATVQKLAEAKTAMDAAIAAEG